MNILPEKRNVAFSLRLSLVFLLGALPFSPAQRGYAEQLFSLRNGMVLRGTVAEVATLKEGFGAAAAGEIQVRPIWYIDDGLRRTFIHGRGMVGAPPVDVADLERTIEIWQKKPLGGKLIKEMGTTLGVSPFNVFGRRQLTMSGPPGGSPLQVIQGLIEINSRYAKLIAVDSKPQLNWDMRLATSSIDSATLNQIFKRRMDQKDLNARLEVVRFFTATKRYLDAKQALLDVIRDFPSEKDDLKPLVAALTDNQAEQLLEEAQMRAEAGQFVLAGNILKQFPTDGLGRITKIKVQDALGKLNGQFDKAKQLSDQLRSQAAGSTQANALQEIIDEITSQLSPDTLTRLSDYERLRDSNSIAVESRLSLAVSGWLLGSGQGIQNLTVAISLVKVRDKVREYLATSDAARREEILRELSNLEGAAAEYVDRMLPLIKPPLEFPAESQNPGIEGMFAIDTGTTKYMIQLPPEYNPLRSYPCVISLHESRSTPQTQIDWWAGAFDPETKIRRGHATRHGFIVVAPIWSRPRQRTYEYTALEHQRVLVAMRDAMRRCSIDSDRVFVAGHGEGGTAAWDIALAHPDLWAGLISISGSPSKTVPIYEPNSRTVPMYLVMGEYDGSKVDGAIIDDYMSFKHDAMVVMYRGRGREFFYDEVPRLFEWMKLSSHKRRELPTEMEVATIRNGDQFFWWVELGDLNPGLAINPILWDEAKKFRPGRVVASIGADNQIRVRGPSDTFRIMLRPQTDLDFAEEIVIRSGSRTVRVSFDGQLKDLLEDARTRADRRRPFWMSVSVP